MNFVEIINIKENQRICIINMPVPNREELSDLPQGVIITTHPAGTFNKVVLFTNTKAELITAWDRLMNVLVDKGEFWIGYPNKGYRIYNEIDNVFIKEILKEKNIRISDEAMLLPGWNGIKIEKQRPRE